MKTSLNKTKKGHGCGFERKKIKEFSIFYELDRRDRSHFSQARQYLFYDQCYKMFSYDPQSKVLSGIQIPPFYHQNVSVGQIIMHYLQREPAKNVQACYDDGVELTAGEMAKLASRIAGTIKREGFKVGDVVGLVAKNTTYVAPLFLGCLLAGCPISTLDPSFDAGEVANIFTQTKPQIVFCDHDNRNVVCSAMQRCGNDNEVLTVDEKSQGK